LEHVKTLANNTAGDFRRIVFRGGSGMVFDIWVVRWSLSKQSSFADNNQINAGLSIRAEDQIEDSNGPSILEMNTVQGVFAMFNYSIEAPTDVGLLNTSIIDTLVFPKPYTVPWLATVTQETITGTAELVNEVWFERRRATQKEIASLVIEAGGRTRT